MTEFLAAILGFPTIFYTGFLGLAVVYWVFVIVGALDVDLLDPSSAADAAADGAIKGVAELASGIKGAADLGGGMKGMVEGAHDAAADAAADAGADAAAHAADGAVKGVAEMGARGVNIQAASETAGLLGFFRIKDVPITITGSLWILWSWAFSYLGMYSLGPNLGALVGLTILGLMVMFGAGILAFPVAAISAKPFAGVFTTEAAQGHEALVGQIVQISTGRVDGQFGQANYEDGQGGLLLAVRCTRANALVRGDDALIVDYDAKAGNFMVEPLDPTLAADDERRARAVARIERERA